MTRAAIILSCCVCGLWACSSQKESTSGDPAERFNVVVLGDAGERNGELRSIGNLLKRMQSGEHDGGRTDAMVFVGDNFYPTGLNVPASDVEDKVDGFLNLFDSIVEELPADRIQAVACNHDYYTHHAFETSVFFGLVDIEMGPIGMSDKGNEREKAIVEWTYHYNMPGSARFPLSAGSSDSVEFIIFDSARLLRTEPPRWNSSLDSLERLLLKTSSNPHIRWRVLATHHPLSSVGEHGGYTVLNDETREVEYLTPCDKDSNALGWFKNFLDPEDLCTERYRAYVDSLKSIIGRSGARIHLVVSGHDHSLQLISSSRLSEGCADCPTIQIVSGAASKVSMVKRPNPPTEFTAFDMKEENGLSRTGFVQLGFGDDRIRVVFFNGKKEEPLDMGGGRTEFWIDHNGVLVVP